jgi:hypothetical protein
MPSSTASAFRLQSRAVIGISGPPMGGCGGTPRIPVTRKGSGASRRHRLLGRGGPDDVAPSPHRSTSRSGCPSTPSRSTVRGRRRRRPPRVASSSLDGAPGHGGASRAEPGALGGLGALGALSRPSRALQTPQRWSASRSAVNRHDLHLSSGAVAGSGSLSPNGGSSPGQVCHPDGPGSGAQTGRSTPISTDARPKAPKLPNAPKAGGEVRPTLASPGDVEEASGAAARL